MRRPSARILAATRLHQWLAHIDDAAYADALAFVTANDGLPHGMLGWHTSTGYDAGREAIAYLFPDHQPFFARAVEELRGARTVSSIVRALGLDGGRVLDPT